MAKQLQFDLRALFGTVVLIASLLGSARVGLVPCISCGIPLGWLGRELIMEGPASVLRTSRAINTSRRSVTYMALVLILNAFLPGIGWWPHGNATWMFLVGTCAWEVLLLRRALRTGEWWAAVLPLCAAGYPGFSLLVCHEAMPWVVPSRAWHYVEWRTDRHRVVFLCGLEFGKDGPNRSLLARYAPQRDEIWILNGIGAPGRYAILDRGDTRSVLLRPMLPEILAALPSEEARRATVAAMADPTNLARAHQGLFLTWFTYSRPPAGQTSEIWWREHRGMLSSVQDAQQAARLALTLREQVKRGLDERGSVLDVYARDELARQFGAATAHERGQWGGDEAFAEACYAILLAKGEAVPRKAQGTAQSKDPAP
jgi:hypothetical protein